MSRHMRSLLPVFAVLLLIGVPHAWADRRICKDVIDELNKEIPVNSDDPEKNWNSQEPLCRVGFCGNPDLTRYNVPDLAGCIKRCKEVPSMQDLMYGYRAPGPYCDNYRLKGNITTTIITLEDDQHVVYVSLTKPVKVPTGFDDSKFKTSFVLGTIVTALGLIATLGKIVGALAHFKDETLPNVFCRASSAMGKNQQLSAALLSVMSQEGGGSSAPQMIQIQSMA